MMNFKWSEESVKKASLSDEVRSAVEKAVCTELERSLADSEKVWQKQQALLKQLHQTYWPQFDANLKIELKKIKVNPQKFEADISNCLKTEDPALRQEFGRKINDLYGPALQRAFGGLGNDFLKLQKKLEKAFKTSPTAKFQWIGPIGFTVID